MSIQFKISRDINLPIEIIKRIISTQFFGKYLGDNRKPRDNVVQYEVKQANSLIKSDAKILSIDGGGETIGFLIYSPRVWDSNYFGFKCAEVKCIYFDRRIDERILNRAMTDLTLELQNILVDESYHFLMVDVDSRDFFLKQILTKSGMNNILTWLDGSIFTSFSPYPISDEYLIRLFREDDLNTFKVIAQKDYYKYGRFYLDIHFDKTNIDNMYSILIEDAYRKNYIILVCEYLNTPSGLFICLPPVDLPLGLGGKVAQLRFLVTDARIRGSGVGYATFAGMLNFLSDKCDEITTGLEVHNIPSLNLHVSLGFRFTYCHDVFHCWIKNHKRT